MGNHLDIKHAFDMEYSTQLRMEKYWLDDHGFKCSFTRHEETNDIFVKTYKYTKTPELFAELANFYSLKKEYDIQRKAGKEIEGPCRILLQYEKPRHRSDAHEA